MDHITNPNIYLGENASRIPECCMAGIIVLLVILILMNGVAIIYVTNLVKNSNLNNQSHLSLKREF